MCRTSIALSSGMFRWFVCACTDNRDLHILSFSVYTRRFSVFERSVALLIIQAKGYGMLPIHVVAWKDEGQLKGLCVTTALHSLISRVRLSLLCLCTAQVHKRSRLLRFALTAHFFFMLFDVTIERNAATCILMN